MNDTLVANSDEALFANGEISVANSILDDASVGPDCSEAITDNGHNVASDATCGLGSTSIQNSTTIGTLALAANGSSGPQTAAITTVELGLRDRAAERPAHRDDRRARPAAPRVRQVPSCDAGAYEIQMSTGYDLAGSDGGVFVFPTGQPFGFFGSLPGLGVKVNNVVGLVPTNNYHGYDLAGL